MKSIFTIIISLISALGAAQQEEQRINWQENMKLEWSDFQGQPDLRNSFDANTSSGISFSWSLKTSEKGSEFQYEVQTYFNPTQSWVKQKDASFQLLAHEQLHFDISELAARKFRKDLSSYRLRSSVKKDLQEIYQKNEQYRQQLQEAFDRETNHGINADLQARWEQKISRELESLEAYSNS